MPERWLAAAACRGQPLEIFYPTDSVEEELGLDAKRICAGCPVARPCLRFAVRVNDRFGIWAGLNDKRRQVLRRLWTAGDVEEFSAAVDEALRWVAGAAAGTVDTAARPEDVCARCGDRIREGARPLDRNGPRATCGLPSTYNDGCRCDRCVAGKADYRARRGKLRATPGRHTLDEEIPR